VQREKRRTGQLQKTVSKAFPFDDLVDLQTTNEAHTYPLSSGAIRWYASSTKELSHA
jgi:hypothetical protein